MNSHFHFDEIPNGDPHSSRFHVIPAPLEKSVSYLGGTAGGPQALIEASGQLELITNGRNPASLGIHTRAMIDPSQPVHTFLEQLKSECDDVLTCGALPVVIGGEHTVSFAPISACAEFYGGSVGVIQIDAHADLRRAYQGNRYSHASVMQRVVEELHLPLFQIGVRAMGMEEYDFRKTYQDRIGYLDAPDLHRQLRRTGSVDIISSIERQFRGTFPNRIYITFDVDGFDASFFPATGTPVPGGLFWPETQELLSQLSAQFSIIGCDVVELAPSASLHYCSFTAAQLVYDLMGYMSGN
jgi:agmatinase